MVLADSEEVLEVVDKLRVLNGDNQVINNVFTYQANAGD